MSIQIEIKSTAINSKNVTAKQGQRAGQVMTITEQEAYAHTFDANGNKHAYPTRIVLNIDAQRGQQPYPPGIYMVSPSSFYANRFNQLELGRLQLVPVNQGKPAAVQAAA